MVASIAGEYLMLELVVPALVVFGVFLLFWGVIGTGTYFGILPLTLFNYSAEVKIVSLAGVLALGLMTKFVDHYWRHRMLGWSFSFKKFFRDEVVWRYKTPISLNNGKKKFLIASFEGVLYFSLYQSMILAIFFTFGVFWFALGDTINQFGARDEFELFGLILTAIKSGDWGSIEKIWSFYVEMLRRPAPKFGFGLASADLLGVIVGSCAAAWKMSLRLGAIKILPMLLLERLSI
jgi:hypothetical protein